MTAQQAATHHLSLGWQYDPPPATALPLPQGQGRRAAISARAYFRQEVHDRLLKHALTEEGLTKPWQWPGPGCDVLCYLWQMKTALARASMPSSAPARWCCHGRATPRLAPGGMCGYVRHWLVGQLPIRELSCLHLQRASKYTCVLPLC